MNLIEERRLAVDVRALTLLLACLVFAGCLEGGDAPPASGTSPPATTTPVATPPRDPELEPLSVRTLAKGSFSGIHEDRRDVLRDAPSWESVWDEHGKDGPAPSVEFPNETVLAVVVHGPTGCAAMHVGHVTFDDDERVTDVEVVFETAPANVQCLVAFEDVYHFVAVPSRDGTVRFRNVTEPASDADASFRTLAQGALTGLSDMRRDVVEDEATWRETWDMHASPVMPPPERPQVDFARERVLVVTAGERGNTCWAIEVVEVRDTGDEARAVVETTGPRPEQACGMAITHPFHFVAIPRADRAVVFEERTA